MFVAVIEDRRLCRSVLYQYSSAQPLMTNVYVVGFFVTAERQARRSQSAILKTLSVRRARVETFTPTLCPFLAFSTVSPSSCIESIV